MSDWFETLFGFTESHFTYKEVQSKFIVSDDGTSIKSITNGQEYSVGNFQCPTVAQLRSQAKSIGKKGTVKVNHVAYGDVFNVHSMPEYRGALFQAASQFNCLEFPHSDRTPELGVTKYYQDYTQGPACAVAAGPAAVFRNYFVCVNGETGQTSLNQVNNMDEVEKLLNNVEHGYFLVRNGYTNSSDEALQRLNERLFEIEKDEKERELLVDAFKIGLHWNVEVPFTSRFKKVPTSESKQFVSQAYCSAISCAYSNASPRLWEPLARLVLEGVYEATLWAAVINSVNHGNNKVLLTKVGGGVFGNMESWIIDAIARAIEAVSGYDIDVHIYHHGAVNSCFQSELDKRLTGLEK